MLKKNKRKNKSPIKNNNKSYKKTNYKYNKKSKSNEENTESSSPISKTEIKNKTIEEIIDLKDITEKLGNSKIFCRDEEKKEIIDFIKLKENNYFTYN